VRVRVRVRVRVHVRVRLFISYHDVSCHVYHNTSIYDTIVYYIFPTGNYIPVIFLTNIWKKEETRIVLLIRFIFFNKNIGIWYWI